MARLDGADAGNPRFAGLMPMMMCLQTSLGPMILETALPDELPVVMGILNECAAWLHSKGIAQWVSPQPSHE